MPYFLGLILALLPTYLIRFTVFGLPTTVLELLIVVFLVVVLIKNVGEVFRLPQRGGLKSSATFNHLVSLGKINYAIGLFVLAGVISTIISPDKRAALGQLKAFIVEPVLVFYAAILIIKTREQLNIILKFLFVSASLISLFGLVQYFTYIHLPLRFWGTGSEVERITSVFDYPNALALYLAPLIGFYFSLFLSNYKVFKTRWLEWGFLAVMALGLVLTFSRGALFATVLICGILLIRKFGFKKTLVPIGILIIALLLIPSVRQRIGLGLSDTSSTTHFDLWTVATNKILANPILGTGLAGFQADNVQYPHDVFLNFWLEMGLLGLLSFCAILILTFEHPKKPNTLALAAGAYLLIMLLHGLVDVPYLKNDLSVLFWFIISIFYLQIQEPTKVG